MVVPLGDLPSSVRSSPGDPHNGLIQPPVADRAMIVEEVSDDAPDMRVGVRVPTTPSTTRAGIPLKIGAVRDDMERSDRSRFSPRDLETPPRAPGKQPPPRRVNLCSAPAVAERQMQVRERTGVPQSARGGCVAQSPQRGGIW